MENYALLCGKRPADSVVFLPPAMQRIHIGHAWLVAAARRFQVFAQNRLEMRVCALFNNLPGPPPRRTNLQIDRKPLFGNNTMDIVLGVIDMAHIRHHATDRAPVLEFAHRWRMHDAQIGVAEKVAAAAQTVYDF